MQRKPLTGPEIGPVGHFVAMNDPRAPNHFLRDVGESLEGGTWRWTGQHPTLRFRLTSTRHLRFVMDFTIADATFRETGPLTISFIINNNLLDKIRYDSPGEKHFEKPVDPQWLRTDIDTLAAAELDKVWVSQQDGVRLGIILTRAGFME